MFLYKVLDRWIRDIYKRVVPVQITGTPEELKIESPQHTETTSDVKFWDWIPTRNNCWLYTDKINKSTRENN